MSDPSARDVLRHLTVTTLMHKEQSGAPLTPEENTLLVEARKELRREKVDPLRRARK